MRYFIDLSKVNDREELHDELEAALPLPAYYGRNLDALNDALTAMAVYYPSCIFIIRGAEEAGRGGAGDDIRKLRRLCSRLEQEEENLLFIWE